MTLACGSKRTLARCFASAVDRKTYEKRNAFYAEDQERQTDEDDDKQDDEDGSVAQHIVRWHAEVVASGFEGV
jgi:hypothetical protein